MQIWSQQRTESYWIPLLDVCLLMRVRYQESEVMVNVVDCVVLVTVPPKWIEEQG